MKLTRIFGGMAIGILIASCSTSPSVENVKLIINNHELAIERCKAAGFKTAVQKTNCYNAADQPVVNAGGMEPDLFQYLKAKRIEIAKRIDSGKMSREEGNAEISRIHNQLEAEGQKRRAQRLATVLQIMQVQQQNNTLSDIARSQRRMADAMDDANDIADPSRKNDPFRFARDYSRGY